MLAVQVPSTALAQRARLPAVSATALRRFAGRRLFSRGAWAPWGYALLSLPLAVLSFAALLPLLVLGAVLSVTPFGLWIIAVALRLAQAVAGGYRWLAGTLIDERLTAAQLRSEPGPLGWRRSVLTDSARWRQLGYAVVKVPLALFSGVVTALALCYG